MSTGDFPGRPRLARAWPVRLGWALFVWFLAGCSTTDTGTASHASVSIAGHPEGEIALTTRNVFEEQGWKLAKVQPNLLIFERPGTKGDALKYGGWDGAGVVVRAKVTLETVGPGTCLVRCDVFAVRDAGQSIMEDENRMMMLSRKEYRKLLDEVKVRMTQPPGDRKPSA
jgi:hypothetical protein